MERYKVALVTDYFLPRIGGMELHVRDLAQQLTARGHEAHVICVTPGPQHMDGIRLHRLDVPRLPVLQSIRDRASVAQLEALLRRERFDIVHAHDVFSPMAHIGTLLARKLDMPSVFTLHSVLKGGGNLLMGAIDRILPWTQWPTVLTAVSQHVAGELQELSGREVEVVLNATNAAEWITDHAPAEELRVTSVMRFTRRKRPLDIVRMIPMVHEHLPAQLRPRFTIVGDGPERARVEREAIRLGVRPFIELPGALPRATIRGILEQSALFILPSIKEALPLAVLEARAAGLPVIARTANGVSEIIEHGVQGFLARDLRQFAAYTARLIEDRELRLRMSRATRLGMERFGWDQAIKRHMEIYRLAIRRHHGEPRVAVRSFGEQFLANERGPSAL